MLSNHVYYRAFGDASYRREDVRHATLLFCALERWGLVKTRRGEGDSEYGKSYNYDGRVYTRIGTAWSEASLVFPLYHIECYGKLGG